MRAIKRFGVEKVVDAGDVIKCTGSVASAMRLFDTTFAAFHNADKSTCAAMPCHARGTLILILILSLLFA